MSDEDNIDSGFDEDFSEDPFEDFDGGGGSSSFSELLRTNPAVKAGVIIGGFLIIVLGMMLFGDEEQAKVSMVSSGGSDVKQAPGEENVPEAYKEAIQQQNRAEVEKAIQQGTSALPVPVATPTVGRVSIPAAEVNEEDPLERWRRIQEERQKQEAQAQARVISTPGGAPTDPNAELVQQLAEAMGQQMSSVLQTLEPEGMFAKSITSPTYFEDLEEQEAAKQQQAMQGAGAGTGAGMGTTAGATPTEPVTILLPAGTIEYAQLITEANSDAPGPILAQIVSGPLAGSRLLGTFETEDNFLVLSFDVAVIEGISHTINAVALDPGTTSTGVVTDIDRRYFQRVVLPAAAAFIEGVGSAIAEAGSTSVTVEGGSAIQETEDLDTKEELAKGVEEASKTVSEIIDDRASEIEPMIKVASGTPLGIMFVEPVTDNSQ